MDQPPNYGEDVDPRSSTSLVSEKAPNLYRPLSITAAPDSTATEEAESPDSSHPARASTQPAVFITPESEEVSPIQPTVRPTKSAPQPYQRIPQYLPPTAPIIGHLDNISIASKEISLSSGFAYHEGLFHMRISPSEWEQFSREISVAARPTIGQQLLSVGAGVLLIEPITGTLVGRRVWRGQVARNAKAGIKKQASGIDDEVIEQSLSAKDNNGKPKKKKKDDVATVLRRWNKKVEARGIMIGLELPLDKLDRGVADAEARRLNKKAEKAAKKAARSFRAVVSRTDAFDAKATDSLRVMDTVEVTDSLGQSSAPVVTRLVQGNLIVGEGGDVSPHTPGGSRMPEMLDDGKEKELLSPKTPGGGRMSEMFGDMGKLKIQKDQDVSELP